MILDKVMQLCSNVEVKSSSPSLSFFPFPSLLYLTILHLYSPFSFTSFPFPTYPTFPLPSPSTSLPYPFRSFLYSSYPPNHPPSLLFLFPTYLFPCLVPVSFPTYLLSTYPLPSLPLSRLYFFPLLPFPFSLFPSSWVFDSQPPGREGGDFIQPCFREREKLAK